MVDVDKCIRDLRFAAEHMCLSCAYDDILNDAITLLEKQRPRVMTLDEVKALPGDCEDNTPVWMETRIITDRGLVTYLEASVLWLMEDGCWRRLGPIRTSWEDVKADDYDFFWRCWTARPSDEQREAVKWKDLDQIDLDW